MVFIILAIISIAHAVFTLLTNIHTAAFFRVLNPVIYAGLWILICAVKGRDSRPLYKGQHAMLIVSFGIAMYITLFVLMGIFFGFSRNMMVPNMDRWFDNLLMFAPVALLAEVLRHRLIREANKQIPVIVLITVVFIFVQINNFTSPEVFFTVIAPIIVLNVVLSYMAIDGPVSALLLLKGVFILSPVLMPALPAVPNEVWALFMQVILFTVIMLYRNFMPEHGKKRRELQEPFLRRHIGTFALVLLFLAFNFGVFPVSPSVVLTGSMTGTIERGSVALVRRNFDEINEGDIILFENERNMAVMHRVIEVRTDFFGELYFVTQGDANERPDTMPVRIDQVNGIVFGSFRHLGMPRVWTHQLVGQ